MSKRCFVELDTHEDVMRDESTILGFRHLLDGYGLAVAIFAEINAALLKKDLSTKRSTVVDATLIPVSSSTTNEDEKHDLEMTQTKKGNRWHFGMKAYISADGDSGFIRTVECITAKVPNISIMENCLHEEKVIALCENCCHRKNQTIDAFQKEGNLSVLTPTNKPASGTLTEGQKAFNRMLSSMWAIAEHPFRVAKRQFGFVNVRYCTLAKDTTPIIALKRVLLFVGATCASETGKAGRFSGVSRSTLENRLFFIVFLTACVEMTGCSEKP